MKRMNLKENRLFLCCSMLVILITTGCTKGESDSIIPILETKKSIYTFLPVVEKSIEIDTSNDVFIKFKSIEIPLNKNLINTKLLKVTFKNYPDLVGMQIKFPNQSGLEKDLFFVYEKKTLSHLTLIREMSSESNVLLGSGSIVYRDITGVELYNDEYKNNKIINKQNIVNKISTNNSVENIRTTAIWNCTRAQFDEFYREAKNTCENDSFCDFACSFNPCAISYVAFAVGKCTGMIQ